MSTKNLRNNGTVTSMMGNRPLTIGCASISQGARPRLFVQDSCGNPYAVSDIGSTFEPSQQNPIRSNNSVSLGNAATLHRLQQSRGGLLDISSTLNPKRVSVATSNFWDGHPDMAHLLNNVSTEHRQRTKEEDRRERPKTSLWGNGAAMESWGWGDPPALKKGILLQQKEKHFLARWKERYCILTRDYLHCFRRTTSIHRSGVRLSEMGNFIFKLRLADMEEIQLEKRRVGIVISIVLPNEPKILFKVIGDDEESTRQWFTLLQECLYTSKERRQALRTLHSSGTEALRNHTNRHSLSEGSPTSTTTTSSMNSSSDPDGEKDMMESQGNQRISTTITPEKVILRREINQMSTGMRDFQETNRHSISIGEDFPDELLGGQRIRRPDSWAPQPPIAYKTSSLVPSAAWLNSGNQQRASIAAATPTFSRASSHLFAPSMHTSEITFRKMS